MTPSSRDVRTVDAIDARLSAPPSKSVTQRALILAALAGGSSHLARPLDSEDTRILRSALSNLGIPIHEHPSGWIVEGKGGEIPARGGNLDAGDAGTAARFLTALVTLGRGRFVVDGSPRMRQRPIQPLVDGIRALGGNARCLGSGGCPPVEIEAGGLPGGAAAIPGDRSSQFLSALLLASGRARAPVRLSSEGRAASAPYVWLTVEMMREFGIPIREGQGLTFDIDAPAEYSGRDFAVEGDYSSAGYFFAAAAISGGRARVSNLRPESAQADRRLVAILADMGCRIEGHADGWTVSGEELRGMDDNLEDMPDAAPTLAVVSLFARGKSRWTGLASLRIKESDRLAALAREIRKLGAEVAEGEDFLEILPRQLRGAEIETYRDHRMAMSFALAGLRIPGVRILDPGCVAKSFPEFWDEFDRLPATPRE